MTNYQGFQVLFQMLKVKRCVKKHQFNKFGWGMVKIMNIVLLEITRATFVATIFIPINANKVMAIDNTQCISMHFNSLISRIWKERSSMWATTTTMSSKTITSFETIELVSHCISKISLPFLLNRALLCPQKKYGYVHS
jgi:hypothetical protein